MEEIINRVGTVIATICISAFLAGCVFFIVLAIIDFIQYKKEDDEFESLGKYWLFKFLIIPLGYLAVMFGIFAVGMFMSIFTIK